MSRNTKFYNFIALIPVLFIGRVYAQAYPSLPPSLSTSVTPNVMLHIDNSGSMSGVVGGVQKIVTARNVGNALITANPDLRWGVFAFDRTSGAKGGKLQAPIGSSKATLEASINALGAHTNTPLAEALLEMTNYFAGEPSYYGKRVGNYTSPIQYRCQKNFAIVITDGEPFGDDELPGNGTKPKIDYISYNSQNNAETRTFGVCTNTTNISNYLTCPARLEGSSTNNAFKSGTEFPRALRDVAMYAYDKDLRVGTDLDLDGKSFDDPKFRKQNLQTYTVGFAVNAPVLRAAATVGKGKYYTAGDNVALAKSLQNAVDDIVSSTSNAGGVATQSETSQSGNKVFQPVFNPNGWYGELRCFNLDPVTGLGNACTPNPKATIPVPTPTAGRNLYTSKTIVTSAPADNETTAFEFKAGNTGLMTASQLASLGSTAAERTDVINFVRGIEGIAGFRSRNSVTAGGVVRLGDIIDGQPVVVSKPFGATNDSSYNGFISDNANRNLVYVGANDGMLHGFAIDESSTGAGNNMREVFGYVPSAVYPSLAPLTKSDYGSGTPHVYSVNGPLKFADVKLNNAWKTIVVGGLGQGGQGYYAIDSTNASALETSSSVKWEWRDTQAANMGYSFGAPIIYNVRTSQNTVTPAVIVSNGYQSDYDDTASGGQKTSSKESALFILDANTGALIKEIKVSNSTGLSGPAGVDVGQDGILDYVYAGDVDGKLWRFDLTATDPTNFKVISTPIFNAGSGRPITVRPAILPVYKSSDGTALGNMVLFGTGQLLTNSDRTNTTKQYLFGILDKMESDPVTVPFSFSATSLVQQTFTDVYTDSAANTIRDGTYRKVSQNSIDLTAPANTNLGWAIELPTSSERLVSTPLVFDDKVLFGTGVPISAEKCLPGGSGWIIGLNPLTGSVTRKDNKTTGTEYSFIDLNADGRSTAAEKLPFSSGSSFISGYSKNGIPTEISYVSSTSVLVGPSDPTSEDNAYGDAGSVIALRESNSQSVYTGTGSASRGSVIKKTSSSGKGLSCSGTIGNDSLECEKLLGAPSPAARMSSTLWREIK